MRHVQGMARGLVRLEHSRREKLKATSSFEVIAMVQVSCEEGMKWWGPEENNSSFLTQR